MGLRPPPPTMEQFSSRPGGTKYSVKENQEKRLKSVLCFRVNRQKLLVDGSVKQAQPSKGFVHTGHILNICKV